MIYQLNSLVKQSLSKFGVPRELLKSSLCGRSGEVFGGVGRLCLCLLCALLVSSFVGLFDIVSLVFSC
jgi:hypothetical protein